MESDINSKLLPDGYCRTCLVELEELESGRKFLLSSELAGKLFSCTRISIEADDFIYPKHLCENCYDQLSNFDSFRRMCIASQHRLDKIVLTLQEADEGRRKESQNSSGNSKEIDESSPIKDEPENVHESRSRKQGLRRKQLEKESIIDDNIQIKDEPEDVDEAMILTNVTVEIKDEEDSGKKPRRRNQERQTQRDKAESEATNCEQELGKEECVTRNRNSSKVFQCDLCSMRFLVEHRYTAHKRTHDGLVPYPCPRENCDRGFERWHSLSEHLKQHDGTNRWFTCDEENCNRQYKHKATLDLHLRRFHKKGPELKSFVCEVCGKVFKSSAILNDHRFTHIDKSELPFACHKPTCKYRFSNRAKLKIHMMRHAGIKRHVCPHCGMRKTTRNELNIHINYHTLERRFPCRFCSQVCNNAGNLKVHIRTVHERAKDYACRYCDRTFAKPDTRKYHEMIHTGEKPHKCSDCGKRFVQPAALRAHKKVHLRQQAHSAKSQDDEVEMDDDKSKITSSGDEKLSQE